MDTNTRIIGKGHPEEIYTVPSPGQLRGEAPAVVLIDPLYAKNCASVMRTCAAYGIGQLWWTGNRVTLELERAGRWPREERDRYRGWLLAGYQEVVPIDEQLLADISWFLRLRILYVYLDRLMLFGATPTAEQQATLNELRRSVHERFEWDR